jgi:hypothetical protein
MALPNTLAYYNMVTITAPKSAMFLNSWLVFIKCITITFSQGVPYTISDHNILKLPFSS